jgi:PAS domain S-box-containing protein
MVKTLYRVLYVDDELTLLEVSKIFLERRGNISVDTAESAREGLEKMANTQYDAIISDYQMPEMDGIAFLKIIRKTYPELPFILFTGRGREEVVIEAINSGSDSYLQKGGDPKAQFAELEHRILIAIERRQAVKALRESEKKYRLLLEGLHDSIIVHRNARILYLNPACEKVLRYSRDALLGKSIMLLVPPEFQEMVTIAVKKRMAGETFEPYELDLIRGDGSRVSVLMSGNLIEFEGAPASVNLITDITARRRTEKALQDSERKYRSVIESIQDVFYRADTQGNLTMASPSLKPLLGYDTLEECLGKNIAETVYLYPAQRRAFLDEITRNGFVKNYEVTLKRKDGSPVFVSTSSHLLFDDCGEIIGVEGIFRDITAQKTAEAELEKSLLFLESIVQGLPIPTFVIDKHHRVISWNKALEEYSGIPAADVIGVPEAWKAFYRENRPCLADLIISTKPEEIGRLYRGKYAKSRIIEGAYEATDFFPHMKGGTWLFFTAAPIRNKDGTVIGAVESLQDVTAIQKRGNEHKNHS